MGKVEYSWSKNKDNPIASRIDLMLATKGFSNKVFEILYKWNSLSDHKALLCTFLADLGDRGPVLWKMNSLVLKDPTYCDEIESLIDNFKKQYENMDAHSRWELFKYEVAQKTRSYSKDKAVKRKKSNEKLNKT